MAVIFDRSNFSNLLVTHLASELAPHPALPFEKGQRRREGLVHLHHHRNHYLTEITNSAFHP